MKNRYNIEYSFAKVEDSLYQFHIPESETSLIRVGGREEAVTRIMIRGDGLFVEAE
jgi:hypothetical protein